MKMRSASMPVPHASSGFAASSPGSSASWMRAVVASEICANGTPRSAATSTNNTRSPPESWIDAMPPPVVTRRGLENSSIASAISSSVATRRTPYASNNASYAPSSPARAPECAVTIGFDRSVRPTFSAITGTSASAAAASAARNASGRRIVSISSAITRVDVRPSAYAM